MSYPIIPINPSFNFARSTDFNNITSQQGNGRPLRRLIDPRPIRTYTLLFENIDCSGKDQLVGTYFEAPFQINTPDDGYVSVIVVDNSVEIMQVSPSLWTIQLQVEELLFTG